MPVPRTILAPGYDVPRLIIGGWQVAEGHSESAVDRPRLFGLWEQLAEEGLNTFDCADIYTGVESLIGEFIRFAGGRRIQVHTKFVPDLDVLARINRQYVSRIIDRSLSRLGVETIDLVQFHWWDHAIPGYVETASWLDELRRAGKIRHLGVTNMDVPRLAALVDAGMPIVSNQVQYSVLDHRPEHGMADCCLPARVGLLCYGTVAGGFLSERWIGQADRAESLENRSLVKYRLIIDECGGWESFQRLLGVLRGIAVRHRVTIASVAQRYVLEKPAVAAAIVGMRSEASATAGIGTFGFALDDADRAAIATVLGTAPGPEGDVYGLERIPGGRHAAIMRYNLNEDRGDGGSGQAPRR
jgi:aryl-alcohol dehydrogenase-like predicted oxidoreductase